MSELRTASVADLAGTGPVDLVGQSAAKAWVNFNGTSTVAVRDSLNVSSLTDNGTGDYTVNFTNDMGSINYSVSALVDGNGAGVNRQINLDFTTNAPVVGNYHMVVTETSSSTQADNSYVMTSILGDLA